MWLFAGLLYLAKTKIKTNTKTFKNVLLEIK